MTVECFRCGDPAERPEDGRPPLCEDCRSGESSEKREDAAPNGDDEQADSIHCASDTEDSVGVENAADATSGTTEQDNTDEPATWRL